MKIAISSTGRDLNSNIDPRFGRCAYFIIIDPDTQEYEVFENESVSLGGGAGIQSAQFVASKGVQVVITGNCGPNAMRTLEAAGIKVITGCNGTVRQAIEDYKNGKLQPSSRPTVEEHFGMRRIGSMGRGAGKLMASGNELFELKEQAALLKKELERIETRINQLEKGMISNGRQTKGGLRIAVPIDRNMVSQHFGHAEAFLIAEVEDGEIKKTETRIPPPHEPGVLPRWMSELGIDVVITGGMGQRALSLFDEKGIKVIVGAPQMDPVEIIKEYIKGTLKTGGNVCDH